MEEDIAILPSTEARRSYVVVGATIECTCGTSPGRLFLPQHYNVYVKGKPLMTTWDNAGIINVGPMGSCKAKDYAPCTPSFCMHWQDGNEKYLVMGERPALLNTSVIICVNGGGRVRITKNGQT